MHFPYCEPLMRGAVKKLVLSFSMSFIQLFFLPEYKVVLTQKYEQAVKNDS